MHNPTPAMPDLHHHTPAPAHAPASPPRRRGVLQGAVAWAAAGVADLAFGQAPALRPTAEEILGPFYPLKPSADQGADLTLVAGTSAHALGQVLYLSGRVTNLRGEPVAGADIEIWQANAAGRYTHPGDRNPAPLDPNFEGFARIRTAADGSYRLKTIKPGAYPTPVAGWTRPPHIHFDVRGRASRLATQMYFADEPLNEIDRLLQRVNNKASLIARSVPAAGQTEPDALTAEWNIVLLAG